MSADKHVSLCLAITQIVTNPQWRTFRSPVAVVVQYKVTLALNGRAKRPIMVRPRKDS
jgi:hypothetical protein